MFGACHTGVGDDTGALIRELLFGTELTRVVFASRHWDATLFA
jgi:hypothetical protein